jgi:hypothetical protein
MTPFLAAALMASLAATGDAFASEGLSGRVSAQYVPRWIGGTETGDEDLYVDLALSWGGPQDRASGDLCWRGVKDLNGASPSASNRFRSVYDAYGDDWYSQLFHAYVDLSGHGFFIRTRLGRQYLYQGQPFHFDGLKLTTRAGPAGLRGIVFGGAPVHYFEDPDDGDWLAGAGVEAKPWEGGRLALLYAHVEDDASFFGLPALDQRDDLLVFSMASALSQWGSGLFRYTGVDGRTRDVVLRARGSHEPTETDLSFSYYEQPGTLSEFTTDLSVYGLVQGELHPYRRADLFLGKGWTTLLGWRVGIEAGGGVRRLADSADEGEYNREYERLRLGVGVDSPGPLDRRGGRRFSASAGQVWWWSTTGDVSAIEAELRWRPNERFGLRVGTSFALYQYNRFSLAEETDVRETYVEAAWSPHERTDLRVRYAAEDYGDDLVHEMELGCAVRF